jgi:hypothetical protein
MELLASELSNELSVEKEMTVGEEGISSGPRDLDNLDTDVFDVPYGSDGMRIDDPDAPRRRWDLQEGAKLVVTLGADKDQEAVILGKHPEGHYKVSVQRKGGPASIRYLGSWWVRAALKGEVPHIPLVTRSS